MVDLLSLYHAVPCIAFYFKSNFDKVFLFSSDRERFLLNGSMAPSSKFQWTIQKINGPHHKPNGPFFTCIFSVLKAVQQIVIVFFLPAFIHTFYFHLSKARAKVFPKPVYIYGVWTFHFRF